MTWILWVIPTGGHFPLNTNDEEIINKLWKSFTPLHTLAVCTVQLMDQYPLCKYIYVGEKYSKIPPSVMEWLTMDTPQLAQHAYSQNGISQQNYD